MKHTVTLIPGDGIGPEAGEAAIYPEQVGVAQPRWHKSGSGGDE